MKQFIPPPWRKRYKVMQRLTADVFTGQHSKFVAFRPLDDSQQQLFTPQIAIVQPIPATTLSENKKHNLALAIQRLQNIAILPGAIFSFWHLIGEPIQAKGYLEGRTLMQNQLKADIGGGLCQLSGLLYVLSLKAGLKVLERHPHSQDIYTDATRFAPLGADATVVYGYKDFRFGQTLAVPICLRFELGDRELCAMLCAPQPIPEYAIDFQRENVESGVQVNTMRLLSSSTEPEVLHSTTYKSRL
ncbi:MAG: VanW family protein [Verrucomicrobia bacterium]|nr:VanW family protein [Leptolyngbya sp. ES-bin-22]